jgi:hypothetical protein
MTNNERAAGYKTRPVGKVTGIIVSIVSIGVVIFGTLFISKYIAGFDTISELLDYIVSNIR